MAEKQIFHDPGRQRWKRLRRMLDFFAIGITLVLAAFILNVLRSAPLPELLLPLPRHNYKALNDRAPQLRANHPRPARRKTTRLAS